jgi:hypothetical protein
MTTCRLLIVALVLLSASTQVEAKGDKVDHVSKAFRDGTYAPYVYLESDILRRYGHGDERLDDAGYLRRRYWDPTTEWEVVITSNPDIGPKYRTIDEIRISPVLTGKQALSTTESLKGLTLKGVAIGDPASKAEAATRRYGDQYRDKDRLGRFDVERVCGILDGVSICFDIREKKVVAMAVGAGD